MFIAGGDGRSRDVDAGWRDGRATVVLERFTTKFVETIRALHSTRKGAEERLTALGITLPSRALPPATAPPQLAFAV